MNIGYDARMIRHSGIGVTIQEFLKRAIGKQPQVQLTLFGPQTLLQNFKTKIIPATMPIYSVQEQFTWPKILNSAAIDCLHVPHYNIPLLYTRPLITTIHDLIHLKFPKSKVAYLYAKFLLTSAIKKSQRIIVDSQNTKKDCIELLDCPEEKLRIIHPGPGMDPAAHATDLSALEKKFNYPISKKYFLLYVGNVRPLKNISFLFNAFTLARKKINDLELVCVGRSFFEKRSLKVPPGVHFLGEVNQEELEQIYSRARAFIFPSLYEGFGLPPLEAMQRGVPVLCSNVSSLPEVAGEAALYFDPHNQNECAEKICQLWQNEALQKELITKGKENIARFSWEKMTDQILALYQEVAEIKNRKVAS